jgi:hypothetical protein
MKPIRATITKIDSKKKGNGAMFKRIYFEPENPADGTWLKTDLCDTYRNWNRWRSLLAEGNLIGGLILKDKRTVNADCHPFLIRKAVQQAEQFQLL